MPKALTDRARKVMQFAVEEAQRFNSEFVGTEHILLGLLKEGSGVGAYILKDHNVNLSKARHEIEERAPDRPSVAAPNKLRQTRDAEKVMKYSMHEAENLNHNYVGTEHILLGLLCERETAAAQILASLGLNLENVRAEVNTLLRPPTDKRSKGKTPNRLPNALRKRSAHVSVGPVGRAVFGFFAFLSGLAYGATAVGLALAKHAGGLNRLLRHLLVDGFAVASVFMFLTAITFWTGGSRWTDPIVHKMTPKVTMLIIGFAIALCVFVTMLWLKGR